MAYVIMHIASWLDFETGRCQEEIDYFKSYVANTAVFTKDLNKAAVVEDAEAKAVLTQLHGKLPEHDLALLRVTLPVNWRYHRLREHKPHPPTVAAIARKHVLRKEAEAKRSAARKMAQYIKKKLSNQSSQPSTQPANPLLKKFLDE